MSEYNDLKSFQAIRCLFCKEISLLQHWSVGQVATSKWQDPKLFIFSTSYIFSLNQVKWYLETIQVKISLLLTRGRGEGRYSNYFLTEGAAQGLKPLPISKDFLTQKMAGETVFFQNCCNQDPFPRVFSASKNGWFYNFFCKICEMGPSSQDFYDQSGTHV